MDFADFISIDMNVNYNVLTRIYWIFLLYSLFLDIDHNNSFSFKKIEHFKVYGEGIKDLFILNISHIINRKDILIIIVYWMSQTDFVRDFVNNFIYSKMKGYWIHY